MKREVSTVRTSKEGCVAPENRVGVSKESGRERVRRGRVYPKRERERERERRDREDEKQRGQERERERGRERVRDV